MSLCHGLALVAVNVLTTDTVEQMAAKISARTGSAVKGLRARGMDLHSRDTIAEVGIQPGDLVEPAWGTVQYFVRTLEGKTAVVFVLPSFTIEQVKQELFEAEGIPMDFLRISYGGKLLDDDLTLSDYKIEKESTLQLTFRRHRD